MCAKGAFAFVLLEDREKGDQLLRGGNVSNYAAHLAMHANSNTCTVAPAAYHQGPLIPYFIATEEDWRSVAAHVHALTIPLAIKPGFTDREADVNSSESVTRWEVYRCCTHVMATISREKPNPMPSTTP